MLAEEIIEAGGSAEVVETAEFPVVFGRIDVGAERTLLCHGLYDVTPAEEPGWINPPFDPQVQELEGLGRCVVGQGAEDMKTGIACMMNAVDAVRAAGEELPLNLMFVHEASELGSGGIKDFFPRYREQMGRANAAYWLCPMAQTDGTPIVPLGLKGNLMGRLVCRPGEWGGTAGQRDSRPQLQLDRQPRRASRRGDRTFAGQAAGDLRKRRGLDAERRPGGALPPFVRTHGP